MGQIREELVLVNMSTYVNLVLVHMLIMLYMSRPGNHPNGANSGVISTSKIVLVVVADQESGAEQQVDNGRHERGSISYRN